MLALIATAMAMLVQPGESASALEPEDFETTVYFDYGRNDLGSAGLLLVREVASKAKAAGFTKVTVVGHSDRAGREESNYQSALERAEAVASILEEQGFSPADIEIVSKGETEPARIHEDERREPLNRRAVLQFSSR